jgi:uncharacterized spore protein YtfJ
MNMKFDETFDKMLDQLRSMTKTETVVGEPFKLGDFTCIPIIKIGMGFGGGGSSGDDTKKRKGSGAATVAGLGITPVGFLVSRGEEISFLSSDKNKGIQTIFEKVPDLLEKIIDMKDKKEVKSEK